MPSLTSRVPNLQIEGPIINIELIIPTELEKNLSEEAKEIPKPIPVKAIVDTGASHSVIQKDILEKLDLKPINKIKINTPSCENHECYQYYLRIKFHSHGLVYEGVFTATPLKGQNIGCLIGRDILATGILIYIGYDNSFTLSLL